jgi:hypothetical protein
MFKFGARALGKLLGGGCLQRVFVFKLCSSLHEWARMNTNEAGRDSGNNEEDWQKIWQENVGQKN